MKTKLLILVLIMVISFGALISISSAQAQVLAKDTDLGPGLSGQVHSHTELKWSTTPSPCIKVLWDLTHGVRSSYNPSDRYSKLISYLKSLGYEIYTTTNICNEKLSDYMVLVISPYTAWNGVYTSSEKSKIRSFVQNGGGLLIMGDNTNSRNDHINPVAQEFGITCGVSSLSPNDLIFSDFESHYIFNDISEVFYRFAGEIAATSPGKEVASHSDKATVAVAEKGDGRVVATGDANFCDNDYLEKKDNQKFTKNIFIWLSAPNSIHVTSPDGGNVWFVGEKYKITWDTDREIGTVKIDISTTGGKTWWTVNRGQNTPNKGSYSYRPVKENHSGHCLFRVSSIQNPSAQDKSDAEFSIVNKASGWPKQYVAKGIPDGIEPKIDGVLDDNIWGYANPEQRLKFGGEPDDFLMPWGNFSDNEVTWKALWSSSSNLLYVAIEVKDDIAGANDNNYRYLYRDDCIELYTDGNHNGGFYMDNNRPAQGWIIRRDNAKFVIFESDWYTGTAVTSAIKYGNKGNWTLELSMTIFDNYPTDVRPLTQGDIIGWDVWYDDSDNQHKRDGKWDRDHQVGWGYMGPAWYNADAMQELELGPPIIWPIPSLKVTSPNGGENWIINTKETIKWTSYRTSGNVKIQLSRDNGTHWQTLFNTTPDDGSKTWTVTRPLSDKCKIKISDVDGTPSDMSDRPFEISRRPTVPGWKVPITIKGSNQMYTLNFGGDPNATDGYDEGLDEIAPPPALFYYAYFEIGVYPHYFKTDIRGWQSPYEDKIDWTLKIIKASEITSVLTWNRSDLPPQGYFHLVGRNINVNMRDQTSVRVQGNATLLIQYRTDVVESVTYQFRQAGWYLISLPVIPSDNNLNSLFPTATAAFGYNADTRSYYNATKLEPQKGYWLLISSPVNATIIGKPLYNYTESYKPGWHLIGSVLGTTQFTDPNDIPDGSVIGAYGWNTTTNQYVNVYPPGEGELKEKQGYWLAVLRACELTIGSSTVVSADVIAASDPNAFYKQFSSQPPEPPFVTEQSVAELMPITEMTSCNYPNPFNPETVIEYSLPNTGLTKIYIYNALGQRIRILLEAEQTSGVYQVIWDGRDGNGDLVSNGVYLYRIMNSGQVETKKMIMLK